MKNFDPLTNLVGERQIFGHKCIQKKNQILLQKHNFNELSLGRELI